MRLTECPFLARLVWELENRCVFGFWVFPNLRLCQNMKLCPNQKLCQNLIQYFTLRWFCLAPHHPRCLLPPSDGQSSKNFDFIFSDSKYVAFYLSGTRMCQGLMVWCFPGSVKLKLTKILSFTLVCRSSFLSAFNLTSAIVQPRQGLEGSLRDDSAEVEVEQKEDGSFITHSHLRIQVTFANE